MKRYASCVIVAAATLCAACAAQKPVQRPDLSKDPKSAAAAPADAAPAAPPTEVTEGSLRAADFDRRDDLKPIRFDYDSSKLSDDALGVLKVNAEIIKTDPAAAILVSGHTDERGTVAYNLALGQKRAKEVRDYYIRLGVDGEHVATLSFGKEEPLCFDTNEDCWSKNRRSETRVRAKK